MRFAGDLPADNVWPAHRLTNELEQANGQQCSHDDGHSDGDIRIEDTEHAEHHQYPSFGSTRLCPPIISVVLERQ